MELCSYYRRFVASFADIVKPLYKLLEAGQTFKWTPELESVFMELKAKLLGAPILSYPLPETPFILDTDASNHAIGAVLSQRQGGEECAITYFSQTLNHTQRQYCVTKRELLAIIKAVQHFHPYLYGRHFTVRSDHAALRWLLNFKNPEGQLARWIQRLQEYDFEIEHRSGLKHNNADSLSRRPCLAHHCKHCDKMESRDRVVTLECACAHTSLQENIGPSVFAVDIIPSTDTATTDLNEHLDIREAQLQDPDMQPITEWKEKSEERPSWHTVSSSSPTTKHYWSQWKSLQITDGVLYRMWKTPVGD